MNTNRNKIVPIVIGAAVAIVTISILLRFVLFSGYGIPSSYLFLGLPGAGIGLLVLLLRLGVFGNSQRSSGFVGTWEQNGWQQNFGAQPSQYPAAPQYPGAPQYPAAPTAAQHLQELDRLLHTGAISQEDYATRRAQILSAI